MGASSPGLHCCLDTLVPRASRLLAWSAEAEVRLVQGMKGRRALLFAPAGARVLVAGAPLEPPVDALSPEAWLREYPSLAPRWVSVSEDGESCVSEAALSEIPEDFWSSEASLSLHFLRPVPVGSRPEPEGDLEVEEGEEEPEMSMEDFFATAQEVFQGPSAPLFQEEAEDPALQEPLSFEAGREEPSLLLPGSPTERTAVLALHGAEPRVERRPAETRIYAEVGSAFSFVRLPPPEVEDLPGWLEEEALRRPQGYEIGEDGRALAAPAVWVGLLQRGPGDGEMGRSARRAWEVLQAEESRQEQALREVAVPAAGLRAYLEREQAPPVAIRGSSGVFYASLGETAGDERLEVSGTGVEGAPAHVLRVPLEGGRVFAWFAPAGGVYRIGSSDSSSAEALCVRLRPSGLRLPLAATEAQRLWAQGERFSIVNAVPDRAVSGREGIPTRAASPASSALPDASSSQTPRGVERVPVAAPSSPPPSRETYQDSPEFTPPPADVEMYEPNSDLRADLDDVAPSRERNVPEEGPPSYFNDVPLPDEDEVAPEVDPDAPPAGWEEGSGFEPAGGANRQRASRGGGGGRGGQRNGGGGGGGRGGQRSGGGTRPAEAARPSFVPSEEEVDEVKTPRHDQWHTVQQGQMTIANWKQRSPRGELWASELLETLVDHAEELDALGCLVPIRLLRAGHQISRSDKEAFDEVFRRMTRRLEQVRVFEIEGRSYFARPVGEKIRLVGPRGVLVRTESVREVVAKSFDKDPRSCFVEAEERGVPVGERSGVRRSGR